jgi:hypothetical protein
MKIATKAPRHQVTPRAFIIKYANEQKRVKTPPKRVKRHQNKVIVNINKVIA